MSEYNVDVNGADETVNVTLSEQINVNGGGGESTIAWLPDVDASGNISWTRSSTTTAPETQNIKGADGADGQDGQDGADGLGIKSVDINASNHLIVTYDDDTTKDAGEIDVTVPIDDSDSSSSKTYSSKKINGLHKAHINKVRMIGHRGYSAKAVENSLPAFCLAGIYGFWGAECDVQRTSDGVFVIMHDDDIVRTTNSSGLVTELVSTDLRSNVRVGFNNTFKTLMLKNSNAAEYGRGITIYSSGNVVVSAVDSNKYDHLAIPTLEEYLKVCKALDLVPVIELKETLNTSDIPDFCNIIKAWSFDEQAIIISFSKTLCAAVRQNLPKIKIQPLLNMSTANIDWIVENIGGNCGIDAPYQQATQALVNYAHSHGLDVNVWTCDNYNQYEVLRMMGVDYITTNSINPDKKSRLMDSHINDSFNFERLYTTVGVPIGAISLNQPTNQLDAYWNVEAQAAYWAMFESIYTSSPTNDNRRIASTLVKLNGATRIRVNPTISTVEYSVLFYDKEYKAIYDGGWINTNNTTDGCFVYVPPKAEYFLLNTHFTDNKIVSETDIATAIPLKDRQLEAKGTLKYSKECIISEDNFELDDALTLPSKTASRTDRVVHKQHYVTAAGTKQITIGPFYTSSGENISACNVPNGMNCNVEVYDRYGILTDYGAYSSVTVSNGYLLFTLSKSDSSSATIADVLEAKNSFYAILS